MYLTGTYKHNLDAKSRVTLPASFRKQVGDQVCLVPVGGALFGFTPESHQAWIDSFFPGGFNPRNRKDDKLRRALASKTVTVDVDSAGRLALGKVDAAAIEKCGIEREVAIVGNIDHFEIWDAPSLDAQLDELDEDLEDLMFTD
ncbi:MULTISPECIES: division/cell wall cluster transcriptional repressor MraZ [Olsenella]|uniref:division/cell wall cluster transcriptional repressor MraZ n=1 Tax=Olsenella TaxID=133925 RepID=UPI00071C431E|nr:MULTISPECIES: MraZ family transcriptional regulator [Olsenella]OFK24866.1 MraZ family transcriptional regulator [Olsenella sp. HMSC062G07]